MQLALNRIQKWASFVRIISLHSIVCSICSIVSYLTGTASLEIKFPSSDFMDNMKYCKEWWLLSILVHDTVGATVQLRVPSSFASGLLIQGYCNMCIASFTLLHTVFQQSLVTNTWAQILLAWISMLLYQILWINDILEGMMLALFSGTENKTCSNLMKHTDKTWTRWQYIVW